VLVAGAGPSGLSAAYHLTRTLDMAGSPGWRTCLALHVTFMGLADGAAIDLPAEAARQRSTEALWHLDEVIRQIRDTAYTSGTHQDAVPMSKPGHDRSAG